MVRDGQSYLNRIRDGRRILIDGEAVDDVTTHHAFRRATLNAAHFYDYQAEPQNRDAMTFVSPTNGGRVSRAWQLPRNLRELVERRVALTRWSMLTCGMVGRSPDHVASTLCGFRMGLNVYRANTPDRAAALESYFDYARDNDLYLSYVIINPQADKAKSAGKQADPYLVAAVCDEDSEGITIRGGKMLATSGVMADELLVSGFQAAAGRRRALCLHRRRADQCQGPEADVAPQSTRPRRPRCSTIRCRRTSTRTMQWSISTT